MKQKILKVLCAVLSIAAILCSCGVRSEGGGVLKFKDGEVKVEHIVEIGEHKISYDMYRYWFLTFKAAKEESSPNIDWTDEENINTLKQNVLEQLKLDCAVWDLAAKYGYSLSEEDKAEVRAIMTETFEGVGNASDYEALLSENFLTNDVYEEILSINAIYSVLNENLAGTDKEKNEVTFTLDEALDACNEEYYRLVDIYFAVETVDEEGNALSESQVEANKAAAEKKINEAYNKVKSGKDFLELMKELKGEEEYEQSLQGYYEPQSLTQSLGFDVATLDVGETSSPIYLNNTYIILHRLENDDEYLKENGVSPDGYNLVSLEAYYAEKVVGRMVEEIMDTYEVTELKYYDEINTDTLV